MMSDGSLGARHFAYLKKDIMIFLDREYSRLLME